MDELQIEHIPVKNVSYLRARDPSILSWNRPIKGTCLNYEQTTLLGEDEQKPKVPDTIQIYLRIKKTDDHKLYKVCEDNQTLVCHIPEGSHNVRCMKEKVLRKYTFSKIFGVDSTQSEIFDAVVKPKLLRFINSENCSLLTYGASGSGKTFTIVGTSHAPGIIPRALEYLFRTLPQLPEEPKIKPESNGTIIRLSHSARKYEKSTRVNILNASSHLPGHNDHVKNYSLMQQRLRNESVAVIEDDLRDVTIGVWVSFAEIYNEHIYDLLQIETLRGQPRPKLCLGNCNGRIYIKNLTAISVSSGMEAFRILQYGLQNVNYAATTVNKHSSRSHCIFTIQLAQASETRDGYNVSYFSFCDLAGSERLKKTMNEGDRLKESNNINTSLLVLGRCISAIRDSQKQGEKKLIPFRESKLTQIFRRALSGLEDIGMMVNMNPTEDVFEESQHVLNFSAIAKQIVIEQEEKPIARSTSCRDIQEESKEEMEKLKGLFTQLYMENDHLRSELAEIDESVRREVIEGYEDILSRLEESHKNEIHRLKEEHKRALKNMEEYYKMLFQKINVTEVINLDSSDEEI